MFRANLVTLALLFALTLALPAQPPRARVLPTPTVTALTNIPAADMMTLTSTPIITEPDADPVTTFRAALARSSWPASLHHDLETIATCESRLEAHQVGDGGLAFGWLQIRADYHPALAARYALLDGPQNLEAGWAVYEAAGGSFAPWACWARA